MNKQFTLTPNVSLEVFFSDEQSFMVTSSLLYTGEDAFLVGAQFSTAHVNTILFFIKEHNLNLRTIYVIHGDPDYYFGTALFVKEFPNAQVLSTAETSEYIK